jgi:hypothetical protein
MSRPATGARIPRWFVVGAGCWMLAGYRDEQSAKAGAVDYAAGHFPCFQFDYDWCRDNSENARRLDEFIREKRACVQSELEKRFRAANCDAKFGIVAQSMADCSRAATCRTVRHPCRTMARRRGRAVGRTV